MMGLFRSNKTLPEKAMDERAKLEMKKLKVLSRSDKLHPLPLHQQTALVKYMEMLGRFKRTELAAKQMEKDAAATLSPQEALAYVAQRLGLPAPKDEPPAAMPSRWIPIPDAFADVATVDEDEGPTHHEHPGDPQ